MKILKYFIIINLLPIIFINFIALINYLESENGYVFGYFVVIIILLWTITILDTAFIQFNDISERNIIHETIKISSNKTRLTIIIYVLLNFVFYILAKYDVVTKTTENNTTFIFNNNISLPFILYPYLHFATRDKLLIVYNVKHSFKFKDSFVLKHLLIGMFFTSIILLLAGIVLLAYITYLE